jgi:hypothetical protein
MASNNAFLQLRHLFSCKTSQTIFHKYFTDIEIKSHILLIFLDTALIFVLVFLTNSVDSGPVELIKTAHAASFKTIRKRSPSVSDRPGCQTDAPIPPNRQNTTERLANLRKQLILFNVDAYIVTSDNAHQVIRNLFQLKICARTTL